ncbi:hypothetical protein [Flavobacterium sp. W21_SRS_FM6]|uniref:hypothetical protein n=1 Tax=Flavobacterium sp. W21_SRS_FM6 TaxID=3240268 RepID=UPI003F8FF3F6
MMKYAQHFLMLIITCGLLSCGGGVSGDNGTDPFNNSGADNNLDLVSYKLGYFDTDGQFVEGKLGISFDVNGIAQTSAGGAIDVTAVLVDANFARVQEATPVSFSSNCLESNLASLSQSLVTVNGQVSNTFIDRGCGGNSGTSDQITASVTIDDTTSTAIAYVDILPDAIGSIRFSALSAAQIVMFNTADNTTQAKTIATFSINSANNIALAGQEVHFSLSTQIGGLSLNKTSALSDENGIVSVELTAGTVPTSLRINASIIGANGEIITSQSELITVSTGLPTQRGFSLSSNLFNSESLHFDGEQISITARLSDTFGNPAPDGTAVLFTAEGGQISSQCLITNGSCSVTWTSAAPRPHDGRVSILATSVGHESFIDSNGNNTFDDEDGSAVVIQNVSSGLGNYQNISSGFIDMSESWRDDNEDNLRSSNEFFYDYNNNGAFDEADSLFSGPQCAASNLCQLRADTIHVRKALVLVMSGKDAHIDVVNKNNDTLASNHSAVTHSPKDSIARGETAQFVVFIADENANPMPVNTTVSMTTNKGSLAIIEGQTVANTSVPGGTITRFELTNTLTDEDPASEATVSVTVTTPKQNSSSLTLSINLL